MRFVAVAGRNFHWEIWKINANFVEDGSARIVPSLFPRVMDLERFARDVIPR